MASDNNVVSFPEQRPAVSEEHAPTYYMETNPEAGFWYFVDKTVSVLERLKQGLGETPLSKADDSPKLALELARMQLEIARRCLENTVEKDSNG